MPESPAATTAPEILLVDDDASIANALADLLRRRGYRVLLASHGRAAMEIVSRQRVGLVISDIFMPECDGIELLTFLRRFTPPIPILAISGSGTLRAYPVLRVALGLGATRTLAKPFSGIELAGVVREMIGPPPAPTVAPV